MKEPGQRPLAVAPRDLAEQKSSKQQLVWYPPELAKVRLEQEEWVVVSHRHQLLRTLAPALRLGF